MLHAHVVLKNIDYQQTLAAFYPMIAEMLQKQPPKHLAIRMLQQLDMSARDAALMLMDELEPEQLDELLCALINMKEHLLCTKLQEAINKMGWGDCIRLGCCCALKKENRTLEIHTNDLKINYGKLLAKPEVRSHLPEIVKSIPMAGMFASMLEGVLVKNAKLSATICNTAIGFIEKSDLYADVEDVVVLPQNDEVYRRGVLVRLPEELQEALVDAAARLVRRLVDQAVRPGEAIGACSLRNLCA